MILKRIKVETMLGNSTNCYIIADEEKKEGIVIDPAGSYDKIEEMINILGINLKYIYLTHCHADHTGALEELKRKTNSRILIHRIESENLRNPEVNLTSLLGMKNIEIDADSRIDDGDTLHVGDIEFKVIYTPGHTNRRNISLCRKRKTSIYRRYII